MHQSNQNLGNAWASYTKHVKKIVLGNETVPPGEVSFWRNAVFCNILTYLTPLSLIALIPSVFVAFTSGVAIIGFADLLTFTVILLLTIAPGIKLEVRKATFIFILFFLSLILLYLLPLPAAGLLFALGVTILSSLVYSSAAAYKSAWANTAICIISGIIIYLEIDTPISSFYNLGAWIAISSNLILLSFAFTKCLDLLLSGLTDSLNENKISEAKLERANRLYQFISQINQTIVHVTDAEVLFKKSCAIALEFGNYKMAWIGSFDTEKNKINLLCSSGIPETELGLFRDLKYDNKGPEDYVLQTGNYFCSNNIEQSPELKSWKNIAHNQKIRSCIVLPIKKSGKIFGAFNLCSSELNYFHEDDIALLKEVTDDISFALDLFEKAERHQKAEIALQKNYEQLQAVYKQQATILNTLPASIALLDHEGKIVDVNDEWIQFGYNNGIKESYEHIGQDYIEIAQKSFGRDADDGKRMAQGLKEILNGESSYFKMEYPCDSPTENRWFKAAVRPFKSQNLIGAVVMHFNISDRKRAEAEMLLLINNTEESFILLNNQLEIVSFNNQFKKLYEKYFGIVIRKRDHILEYVQPERKEKAKEIYKSVLDGNVVESEIAIPFNGTIHSFSLKYSPAKDEFGNIFGAFVTALDMTEKKKALELKEFERSNKEALINSTDDLIWSISNELKLLAANKAFLKEISTITGDELISGDDFSKFEVIPDSVFKHWEQLYERAFLGESFKTEIYNPPSENWDESWIEASFNPIIVKDQIVGIACYSRNITERKVAELERAKITNDLLQRNRDLEQFTFIVSHNLRAPIANIMGITEYLLDENIKKEEQNELIQALTSSVTGLDSVIKDINKILQVKLEMKLKKETISFSKLVSEITLSLGISNEKSEVQISSDFSAIDEIFSIKVYLHSIFYNLISNSIKFGKPDASVLIEIKSRLENDKIVLTFKDNGLGIDLKAKADKIFRLYARFHSHVEGKGMGLFMAKTQTEAIGGNIFVSSEVDQGTEFTIILDK